MQKLVQVGVLLLMSSAWADVSHILETARTTSTPPPPPHPYAFSYSAGRAPGHIDRSHAEVSDGSGTVRGAFSYVDPKHEIRTVQYIADEHGFHAQLSHEPEDTEANKQAAARHFALYHKIAEAHSNSNANPAIVANNPVDTAAVSHAKNKHFTLFERISADHARIAAERELQRLAFEATSEANHLEEDHI